MMLPSFNRELTEHFCDSVVRFGSRKTIGNDDYYLLSHFPKQSEAEQAAEIARSFGYNARVISDYGIAVYIKKSLKKRRK
jgi:hypothetical protein